VIVPGFLVFHVALDAHPCSCKWLCCQLSKHRLGQFGKFSEADIFTCWILWKM